MNKLLLSLIFLLSSCLSQQLTYPGNIPESNNALGVHTFDLNIGNGFIKNNSLTYSLVDLNRSAPSVCVGDSNSVLNSQNQT